MPTDLFADPRRTRILHAARELWLRDGYDRTTISTIAASAHVSKSTIYECWGRKEDLFAEVLGQETMWLIEDWSARIEADPQGGTIAGIYGQGFLALASNPLLAALYRKEEQFLGSWIRERGREIYTPRYLATLDLVHALQAARIVRSDLSAEVVNHTMLLLSVGLMGIGEVFDPTLFPPVETIAQTIAEMMQRALASEHLSNSQEGKVVALAFFRQLRHLVLHSFSSSNIQQERIFTNESDDTII